MSKQEIIDYLYSFNTHADITIEEMAEDLAEDARISKIRAEIETYRDSMPWENKSVIQWEVINYILEQIIDKYREG